MRIFPVFMAVAVTVFLYFLIMERDTLLAFAGNTGGSVEDPTENSAPPRNLIKVVAVKSVAEDVDSAVVLRGETKAMRQVDMRSETSGQVVSPPLRKGNFVKTGQVLCELDPGTREASVAEAKARLAEARARVPASDAAVKEAQARLDEARINDNAARKLSQDGYASNTRVASTGAAVRAAEAGLASATAALESTQSGIESAAAAVAATERELGRISIKAAFDGILDTDTAELGSLMQPGSLCATILQLNPMKIVGYVPETQINRVEIGAQSGARLSDGAEYRGRVSFVSRSADPATRTFQVDIEVDNSDLKIRKGQTAEILISAQGSKAHLLPQSALTLNNHGALGLRLVGENDTVEFAPVKLLRDTPTGVWVAGLPEQANVITVGQEYVIEGVKVAPTYQELNQ